MKKLIFKYVKQLQKNTLICPSEINFLNENEFKIDDNLLIELNNKIDTLNKEEYPKLQIAERDGNYFALNNTMLFLFQNLEQKRKVDKIYCELISLDKVPLDLQKNMVILNNANNNFKSSSESFESCCSESCSECLQNNNNNTITTMISNTLNNQNLNIPENEQTLIIKDDLSITSSLSTSDLDDFDNRNRRLSIIVCNYCDQKFENSKSLGKHKLRKKHFVCTICNERFKNQFKLENHKSQNEHYSDNE